MRALIRFGKQPRLRFISHLDLQRFFQRAVNRTGLPIAYTQGWITGEDLRRLAVPMVKNPYGQYLLKIADGSIKL